MIDDEYPKHFDMIFIDELFQKVSQLWNDEGRFFMNQLVYEGSSYWLITPNLRIDKD